MPIAIELRTTCERCKDPLPLNAWATRIACWSCLHDNPVSPEQWSQILAGALGDAWTLEEGEGRTENLKVGKRAFELRWSSAKKPKGKVRPRPKEMRAELFPGVVGAVGEETDAPTSTENVPFKCPQCAAALTIDGRSRNVDCTYCHATTQLSDDAWRRMHPLHAQRAWTLMLESDGAEVAPAAKEASTAPAFRMLDVATGPDGLFYALVEYDKRALVCFDADLAVRWRADVGGDGILDRVTIVGDEVWWANPEKNPVRRFSRADGKALGKLGGPEPVDARVHHLAMKGATDLIGCPNGTVLALVAHRLVRYDAQGKGILTWPPLGCVWGWLSGEKLQPLYFGPPHEDIDEDDPIVLRTTTAERHGMADHFGQKRPTAIVTVMVRGVASADGSLWLTDGLRVARYDRDGNARWMVRLEGAQASNGTRPALDGAGNAYVVALDDKEKNALYRVDPNGKAHKIVGRVGHPMALAATADGRVLVFGNNAGELRVYDKDGKAIKASAAAVETDRQADEEEAEAEENEW